VQGNIADQESEMYERAAFILAIGLALTAWASLYDEHPQLRLIFTLLAIPRLFFRGWDFADDHRTSHLK
jgi:hypothetical protein